ncbi:MAG: hypothetical protein IJ309_03815 [Clostridia bacterium]|nr:hypothetical protein [Clostridia bacterium]
MALILCLTLAVCASAATYYVDKDGNVAGADSDNLAYEFTTTVSSSGSCTVKDIYVYDASITKIIIPDFADITSMQIGDWDYCLKIIYNEDDGEGNITENVIYTQIEELDIYEYVKLESSSQQNNGSLCGWSGLKKISFRNNFKAHVKSGSFYSCSSLKEIHFYGQNISVPSYYINCLKYSTEGPAMAVFHKGSSGTIETGPSTNTLPTASDLKNNFYLYIHENISPSNADDTRLGTKWGSATVANNWSLIVMVDDLTAYSSDELEALKTSHGYKSRYEALESAVVKEASVMTYCQAGFEAHSNGTSITLGANGLLGEMTKNVGCDKCLSGESTTLDPVFTSLGYSVSETGDLMQGFAVNEASLKEYKNVNNSVVFGLVVGIKEYLTGSQLINTDGTANTDIGKVYSIDFTSKGYQIFEMKVTGLAEKEEYSSLNIYCCGYYVVNNNVYYMSNDVAGQDASGMCTTFAAELEKAKLNDAQ